MIVRHIGSHSHHRRWTTTTTLLFRFLFCVVLSLLVELPVLHHLNKSLFIFDNNNNDSVNYDDNIINNNNNIAAAAAGNNDKKKGDNDDVLSSSSSSSLSLPDWFVEYAQWHRRVKAELNPNNWRNYKYTVLHCLESWPFCSGTSDRLRNFLFLIYLSQYKGKGKEEGTTTITTTTTTSTTTTTNRSSHHEEEEAKDHRRIFLIYWEQPAPLEEFLIPNEEDENFIDWRTPMWLRPKLNVGKIDSWKGVQFDEEHLLQEILSDKKKSETAVEFSFTWQLSKLINERYADQYGAVFRAVFKASPPVQSLIDQTRRELGLVDGKYTAVHLRTKYTSVSKDADQVLKALRCAISLGHRHGGNNKNYATTTTPNNNDNSSTTSTPTSTTIFVASDSAKMAQLAVRLTRDHDLLHGAAEVRVVARDDYDVHPPLHIDMGTDYIGSRRNSKDRNLRNHSLSEYYSVFSDLFLLGGADCVVAGKGNYGRWGRILSHNYSCFGDYLTGEGCFPK